MKKLNKSSIFKLLISFALVIIVVFSCKKVEEADYIPEVPDFVHEDITLPPTTKLLNQNSLNAIEMVDVNNGAIVINSTKQLETVEAGDVLMMGVSSETPNGLLRKVVQKNIAGSKIEFKTIQATLEESIKEASISYSSFLDMSDIASVELIEGVELASSSDGRTQAGSLDLNINLILAEGENGNIKLEGGFSMRPKLKFELDMKLFKIEELVLGASIENTLSLNVSVTGQLSEDLVKLKIASLHLHPIIVSGIVLVPKINLYAGIDGTISATVEAGVKIGNEYGFAAKYQRNDGWTVDPIKEETPPEIFGPNFTGSMSIEKYLEADLEILIFGLVGPEMKAARVFAGFEADFTSMTACLSAYRGFLVRPSIHMTIFSREIKFDSPFEVKLQAAFELPSNSCLVPGIISGLVKDAVSGDPLEGVEILIKKDEIAVVRGVSDISGSYNFNVPPGEGYTIVFQKEGYLTAVSSNKTIVEGETTNIERLLQINSNYTGLGNVGGIITDAFTGNSLAGVTLSIYVGIDNTSGEIVRSTSTDDNGSYVLENLAAGYYSIAAEKEGYNPDIFSMICVGNQSTQNQNGSLTPILNQGEIRIILTWGATPEDLDSHLTGPLPTGGRFHMSFLDQYPYGSNVILDIDDISSYGPETTTISKTIEGLYRYSVHDYSNRESLNSNQLANSYARVRVYYGNVELADLHVPNQEGTLWTVFELNGSDFVLVNSMTYESVAEDILRIANTDAKLIRALPEKLK